MSTYELSSQDIESGMSESFKQKMAEVRELNNHLLDLFDFEGSLHVNCKVDEKMNTIVNYVEATIKVGKNNHLPVCRAIHIEELFEKLQSLYELFKNAPMSVKKSPDAIIEWIEQNINVDPRLEVVKLDINSLFSKMLPGTGFYEEEDIPEDRILH